MDLLPTRGTLAGPLGRPFIASDAAVRRAGGAAGPPFCKTTLRKTAEKALGTSLDPRQNPVTPPGPRLLPPGLAQWVREEHVASSEDATARPESGLWPPPLGEPC